MFTSMIGVDKTQNYGCFCSKSDIHVKGKREKL